MESSRDSTTPPDESPAYDLERRDLSSEAATEILGIAQSLSKLHEIESELLCTLMRGVSLRLETLGAVVLYAQIGPTACTVEDLQEMVYGKRLQVR